MNEKLPKVFANKIENVQNNKKYYYSERDNDRSEITKENTDKKIINKYNLNKTVQSADINKKIIDLFKSPTNVYKVKVEIKINGKPTTKYLIGRTNTTLITLDNEIINISDIEDINMI